jgi:exoribonuclease R
MKPSAFDTQKHVGDLPKLPHLVRVHIADVAASVCSGGDLDLYAARRGCSVFIRDHKEELQRLDDAQTEGVLSGEL